MLVADSFHSEQFSCVQLKGDGVAVGRWYAIAKGPLRILFLNLYFTFVANFFQLVYPEKILKIRVQMDSMKC